MHFALFLSLLMSSPLFAADFSADLLRAFPNGKASGLLVHRLSTVKSQGSPIMVEEAYYPGRVCEIGLIASKFLELKIGTETHLISTETVEMLQANGNRTENGTQKQWRNENSSIFHSSYTIITKSQIAERKRLQMIQADNNHILFLLSKDVKEGLSERKLQWECIFLVL